MKIYLPTWILLLLPSWITFFQHCLRDCQKLQTKANFLINMCWMKKQVSLHWWDSGHWIVCNADSPINIRKFIPPEVWKAFNVGINSWNITQNQMTFTFFLEIFLHTHYGVSDVASVLLFMVQIGNTIPYTCCNVLSLEHDSIPWQANSQRINVDATWFYLLWKLFTIIKIFSKRFELDGGFKNLSKTN